MIREKVDLRELPFDARFISAEGKDFAHIVAYEATLGVKRDKGDALCNPSLNLQEVKDVDEWDVGLVCQRCRKARFKAFPADSNDE